LYDMEHIRELFFVIVEESNVVEATLLVKIICKVVSRWQITYFHEFPQDRPQVWWCAPWHLPC
jgi:hypothetical protein